MSVDASVLDPVLEGRLAEIGAFDPDQPIPVPVVAVAADPAKPDHVLTPDDLDRLVATSSDVRAVTLAGSNHLIHDTGDQREAFWSIVASFLDSLD